MLIVRMDNAPRGSFEEWERYMEGMNAAVSGRPAIGGETFLAGYRDAYAQIENQTARALEYEQ